MVFEPLSVMEYSEKLYTRTLYPSTSNCVPRTLETMYHVPQARNYVPSTLYTMYFHQKSDTKVE